MTPHQLDVRWEVRKPHFSKTAQADPEGFQAGDYHNRLHVNWETLLVKSADQGFDDFFGQYEALYQKDSSLYLLNPILIDGVSLADRFYQPNSFLDLPFKGMRNCFESCHSLRSFAFEPDESPLLFAWLAVQRLLLRPISHPMEAHYFPFQKMVTVHRHHETAVQETHALLEHNEIPIVRCYCGDLMCGYTPLAIVARGQQVQWSWQVQHWDGTLLSETYRFDRAAYEQRFTPYGDYLAGQIADFL